MSLPTLPVEYPAGHPLYRPAPGVDGESAQAERRPSRPPTAEELAQAAILARCAVPLSVPNSPAEQARRMSVGPASRRNSILSIPPPVDNTPKPLDHTPMPGHDEEVDQKELDKELEEIDTIAGHFNPPSALPTLSHSISTAAASAAMSSSLPPPQSPLRPASAAAAAAASNGHAAIPAPPPTAADQAKQLQLAARLRDKGLKRLLHSRQPISERADASDMKRGRYPAAVFPPGKSVDLALKSAGAKGATAAKHRFLFHMPFRFSCRASGRQIGWLCHMNTRNPIMYIQFPIGRVKLFGTVMRSNNVFLAVPYSLGKRAANDQLSVRGTFDRIVAFTEWRWIGKKEDNPEEHELPVPDELSVAPRKAGTLNLGGSMPQSSGSGSQAEGDEAAAAAAAAAHDDDVGIIDLVEGEDEEAAAAAAAAPKARRKRESKPLVLGGSSDDDADEAEDDSSQVRTPSRKRKSTGGASSSKRKKRRIDSDGDDSEGEGEEEEGGSDASAGPDDDAADESDIPQSQSSNRPRRASTSNKISYVDRIVVDDSEDEVAEEEEGEEEVAAADSDDEDFE